MNTSYHTSCFKFIRILRLLCKKVKIIIDEEEEPHVHKVCKESTPKEMHCIRITIKHIHKI